MGRKIHFPVFATLFLLAAFFAFLFLPKVLAQYCPTQSLNPRVQEGLISTPNITSTNFSNPEGRCVVDPVKAPFAPFKIPTYEDLKSLYYTQAKATKTEITPPPDPANQGTLRSALNSHDIILIKGDLEINADLGGTSKPAVVFVDGKLSFKTTNFTFGNANSGIVFVVGGNVIIDPLVTQIDAVIISSGTIYTGGAGCSTSSVETADPLTVNGSLISLDKQINFCRKLSSGGRQASELIKEQPKYLVILRNLYADTLQKWSESQ